VRTVFAVAIYIVLVGAPAIAQDQSQTSPSASSSTQSGTAAGNNPDSQKLPNAPSITKAGPPKETEKDEETHRVMGVIPWFRTTHVNAPPLSSGEKFHLFWTSAFDPVTFVLVGGQAGISQAENSFAGYGQGGEGYAKRYGAAFTDNVTSNFFATFLYPTLFKQDPRYFRLGEGSFKQRLGHSLVEQIVAHQDHGGRMFHFSNVLGALTSGGISNAYYPAADRGFGLTMSRAGIAMAYAEGEGFFDEFWPDIQKRLLKKKNKHPAAVPQNSEPAPVTTRPPPQQ
jgi:hypothetical protein